MTRFEYGFFDELGKLAASSWPVKPQPPLSLLRRFGRRVMSSVGLLPKNLGEGMRRVRLDSMSQPVHDDWYVRPDWGDTHEDTKFRETTLRDAERDAAEYKDAMETEARLKQIEADRLRAQIERGQGLR